MLQRTVLLVTILGLAGWGPVRADDETDGGEGHPAHDVRPIFEDRWAIRVGARRLKYDVKAQGGGPIGFGTIIDLEEDLGYEPWDNVFAVEGYYRFSSRNRIEIRYDSIKRKGGITIQTEFELEGEIFPVGAVVKSDYTFRLLDVEWQHAFINTPRAETGFSLGLGVMDASLKAFAAAGGGGLTVDRAVEEDFTIPFPLIGFYSQITLRPRLQLLYSFQFLSLEYGDFEGQINQFRISFVAYFSNNWGFEIGFASSGIEYTKHKNGQKDYEIDLQTSGGLVNLVYSFGKEPA